MSATITERDRLALLGGVSVIALYQRMIDETIELMAKIVNVEPDPTLSGGAAPYFGLLSDELVSDASPGAIVARIIEHYDVTVTPSSSDSEELPPAGLGQE